MTMDGLTVDTYDRENGAAGLLANLGADLAEVVGIAGSLAG